MRLPWRYILVSLCVGFLVGAAAGLFTAHLAYPRWHRWDPERIVQRYDRELQLTADQRTQIHAIIKAHRDRIRGHRQEVRQAARNEIRRILTPAQQARFDALEKRRDDQHQNWNKRAPMSESPAQ
jgi:Spy/CpxP family protein refolding chaperone